MKIKRLMYKMLSSLILSVMLCGLVFAEGLSTSQMLGLDWSDVDGFNRRLAFYTPLTSTVSVLTAPRSLAAWTFTRASTQWLQDDSGVYTSFANNVPATNSDGYLSEIASTSKVTCYSALTESVGSELVTNGGFGSDTGWTKGTGWAISDGTLNGTAVNGASAYQTGIAVGGRKYTLTYTVTVTSGTMYTVLGTLKNLERTTSGTYTETILVPASGWIEFWGKSGSAFTGSIDNVSIKEIYNAVGTKATSTSTTAIRGMTLSGDANAYAEIVDDSAALTAAGLGNIANGRVVKLDNSAGSVAANIDYVGTVGNTNKHSISAHVKVGPGAGSLRFVGAGEVLAIATGNYDRKIANDKSPSAAGDSMRARANAGSILYFVLPQLEEQTAATSPIITQGATATRAATVLSYPVTAGVFSIPMTGTFYWTPNAVTGTAERYLWGSYADANNWIGVFYDGTNVTFRKRVGGTNYDATKALTAVSGTTYRIGWRINADYSIDVAVNSAKGTGSADTHAPAATTTYQIGTLNGANGTISSQIKDFKIFRKALPDSLMYLDWKYRTADSYLMEVAA